MMDVKKCGICYYFLNKFPVSDCEYSCVELGISPSDYICGDFKKFKEDKSNTSVSLDQVKEEIMAVSDNYRSDIFNIISDIFTFEQDAHLVLKKIEDDFIKKGIDLPFARKEIDMVIDKSSKLVLLHRLYLLRGLGGYAEHVVRLEADKLHGDPRRFGDPKHTQSKIIDNSN